MVYSEVSIESVKAIQADWEKSVQKSKQASATARGTMSRKEFDKMPLLERGRCIKSGIKIID